VAPLHRHRDVQDGVHDAAFPADYETLRDVLGQERRGIADGVPEAPRRLRLRSRH
jgi:hypothetical protein